MKAAMTRHKRGYQSELRVGEVKPASVDLTILSPLAEARTWVPDRLELVRDSGPPRLEWWSESVHESPPVRGCLPSFIKLANARDETIEAFAKKWGVLGICRDGLPGVHRGCEPLSSAERWWEFSGDAFQRATLSPAQRAWFDAEAVGPGEPHRYWEELAAWRYFARRLRAILVLAAALRRGGPTSEEEWFRALPIERRLNDMRGWNVDFESSSDCWWDMRFGRWAEWGKKRLARLFKEYQGDSPSTASLRRGLAMLATDLLNEAAVYPQVVWEEGVAPQLGIALAGPRVPHNVVIHFDTYEWPVNSLYSVLACQVVAAISAVPAPATCDWCGDPYTPEPQYAYRRDRRSFCSQECKIEGRRDRNRRAEAARRARQRMAASEFKREEHGGT